MRPANSTAVSLSPSPGGAPSSSDLSFRHIYKWLLGPTSGGELIAPEAGQEADIYVLS